MLKVMIVDDERIIRYGIVSMVRWEKLGLKLVGEAAEGREGYELFLKTRPDIVITDLKMPGLSGLEMVSKIKEVDDNTKFIILSGYEDFSYAKEAIHLGVSEYLLKSDLMPEDIEQILRNMIQEIKECGTRSSLEVGENEVDVSGLLEGWCQGSCVIPEALPGEMKRELSGGFCCLCIGTREKKDRNDRNNIGLHYEEIKRRMKQSIPDYPIYLFRWGGQTGAMVVCKAEEEAKLNSALKNYILEMEKQGYIVTIGRSPHQTQLEKAYEMFQKAFISYEERAFYGYGKIIKVTRKISDTFHNKYQYPVDTVEKLAEYDRKEELAGTLEGIFNTLQQRKSCEELKFVSMDLLLILNKLAAKVKDIDEIFLWKKDIYEQYSRLELVEDIKNWFIEKFTELLQCQRELAERTVDVVEYIERYVKENCDKKLTLQELSEEVNLNKNYLSQMFKKKTGRNIGSYITEIKIERAKELMDNTTLKANMIAEKVGYDDERYFYKVFKAYTGTTTTEYMKNRHS